MCKSVKRLLCVILQGRSAIDDLQKTFQPIAAQKDTWLKKLETLARYRFASLLKIEPLRYKTK
jgi:hypothetical protein